MRPRRHVPCSPRAEAPKRHPVEVSITILCIPAPLRSSVSGQNEESRKTFGLRTECRSRCHGPRRAWASASRPPPAGRRQSGCATASTRSMDEGPRQARVRTCTWTCPARVYIRTYPRCAGDARAHAGWDRPGDVDERAHRLDGALVLEADGAQRRGQRLGGQDDLAAALGEEAALDHADGGAKAGVPSSDRQEHALHVVDQRRHARVGPAPQHDPARYRRVDGARQRRLAAKERDGAGVRGVSEIRRAGPAPAAPAGHGPG